MQNTIIRTFLSRIKNYSLGDGYIYKMNDLGRWNVKDNSDIKATLANMDCCGDSLCGKPQNYTININKILKESSIKN